MEAEASQPDIESGIEARIDEHYQDGIVSGAMLVGGSLGGIIAGITPVIGYLIGAMAFETALLWQIGFLSMLAAMALSGVVSNE